MAKETLYIRTERERKPVFLLNLVYVFQAVLTQIGLLVISVSLFFQVSPFLTPTQIPQSLQCPLCCVNRVQNDTQKKNLLIFSS